MEGFRLEGRAPARLSAGAGASGSFALHSGRRACAKELVAEQGESHQRDRHDEGGKLPRAPGGKFRRDLRGDVFRALETCGVASKAHEIITEITKRRAKKTTRAFITQAGASKVGRRIDAAWTSSHATTP